MTLARRVTPWPEVPYVYSAELRAQYREGKLFRHWVEEYEGHFLFTNRMFDSHHIPHSGAVRRALGFQAFLTGILYLEAGYEAMCFYRKGEDEACYRKVCELLGGETAGQFVASSTEQGGQAPALLVFKPGTRRFRFVECKRQSESFTMNQLHRFASIEAYLNQTSALHEEPLSSASPSDQHLFPALRAGQWIHVVRLVARSALRGIRGRRATQLAAGAAAPFMRGSDQCYVIIPQDPLLPLGPVPSFALLEDPCGS